MDRNNISLFPGFDPFPPKNPDSSERIVAEIQRQIIFMEVRLEAVRATIAEAEQNLNTIKQLLEQLQNGSLQ